MTKQERNKIQDLEFRAWEELCIAEYYYVIKRFPCGYGYDNAKLTQYETEDSDLRVLLYTWKAYYSVLEKLRVATQYNSCARKYRRLTYEWLEGIK